MFTLGGVSGYEMDTTRDQGGIEAAQRLRFQVFNLELGEGLEESNSSGLDADAFDAQCDHLIIRESRTGLVVGTYRLQTGGMAGAGLGYYSAQEFDFAPYETIRGEVLELGRACIHLDHRKRSVLELLWRGIVDYADKNGSRYLLGCSSLTSQDPAEGWCLYRQLEGAYLAPDHLRTEPLPRYAMVEPEHQTGPVKIPKLFGAYLNVGAVIAGAPALDREFKTIDFLTIFDLEQGSGAWKKRFIREHE